MKLSCLVLYNTVFNNNIYIEVAAAMSPHVAT